MGGYIMRLPRFEYLQPKDLDEALELLHAYQGDCRVLAGGTDLLVRMKQRLLKPGYLISLKSISSQRYIKQTEGRITIGAGTSLAALGEDDLVCEHLPGLVRAVKAVGAPSIQHHAGTIGGNLCQENRCLYYNQSAFQRSTRQPCHKAGGQICYALAGSDRCRSTFQSDCAPILIALKATVTLRRKGETRTIALVDLYSARGEQPLAVAPDELLTEIQVPIPGPGNGHAYRRLSYRSAIEYPAVAVGASVTTSDHTIQDARIVVGAISNAPLLLAQASESLKGKETTDRAALERAAIMARDNASVFVVNNVNSPVEYRQQMIAVLARRALEAALARTN
jgi:4-hydroxybenzoyl-CoA reductase beta subunit